MYGRPQKKQGNVHDIYAIAIMNDNVVVRHIARIRAERAWGDQAAENFGGPKFCRKLILYC